MRYRILINGRFGEGWKKGEIVAIDDEAARVPLEEGVIEPVEDEPRKKMGRPPKIKEYAEQAGA